MNKKNNLPVRHAAEENHMYLWEVANLMNLSYSAFMMRMRSEWPSDEQQRVIDLIRNHTKGGATQ